MPLAIFLFTEYQRSQTSLLLPVDSVLVMAIRPMSQPWSSVANLISENDIAAGDNFISNVFIFRV